MLCGGGDRPYPFGINRWPNTDCKISDLHEAYSMTRRVEPGAISGLRSATASILSGECGAVKCASTKPVEFTLSLSNRPSLDDLLKLRQAIRQSRGARLQNQGRFDFVEIRGLHSVDLSKAWPRRGLAGLERLRVQAKREMAERRRGGRGPDAVELLCVEIMLSTNSGAP
jgi:hypothetical protein